MRTIEFNRLPWWLLSVMIILSAWGCATHDVEEVNIGFIAPLSTRATDLGIAPAHAMELAVKEYNATRETGEPLVNFYTADDKWEKELALPQYQKLRREHNIDVVFISNTDGTVAIQDDILKDGVIAINPLNSDALLSSMNKNTFKIAKQTEEASAVIGIRIVDRDLKNVVIFNYPNDFMTRATKSVTDILDKDHVNYRIVKTQVGEVDYRDELKRSMDDGADGYVFFGYKNYGFAMKQARDMGIDAPFFGSTVLMDPAYYENSEGAIVGTECSFFTQTDGNHVLADEFLRKYRAEYGVNPPSIWPPLQAYDAMNIVLEQIRAINKTKEKHEPFDDWLRKKLLEVSYYQGVCGNISINKDGASEGIYFSLYRYKDRLELEKVLD